MLRRLADVDESDVLVPKTAAARAAPASSVVLPTVAELDVRLSSQEIHLDLADPLFRRGSFPDRQSQPGPVCTSWLHPASAAPGDPTETKSRLGTPPVAVTRPLTNRAHPSRQQMSRLEPLIKPSSSDDGAPR